MYDDVIFADRFRYPLTMFGNPVLIKLSRVLDAHIAYEADPAKIIAAFCWIYYCLCDYLKLNSIDCRVQTTICTMMEFSLVDSVIHRICLRVMYGYVISTPSSSYCICNRYFKYIAAFCRISYCLYDYIRLNSIACRVQTTRCTMMQFSLIDSDIHCLCLAMQYW